MTEINDINCQEIEFKPLSEKINSNQSEIFNENNIKNISNRKSYT